MMIRGTVIAVALTALFTGEVAARDCSSSATLADALAGRDSCADKRDRREVNPSLNRDKKKPADSGFFRNGNTSVTIGGSITSDTGFRSR